MLINFPHLYPSLALREWFFMESSTSFSKGRLSWAHKPEIMRYAFALGLFIFSFTQVSLAQKPSGPYENDTIVVYIFLLEDCVISQNYTLALKEMYAQYASDQITFTGLFPSKFSHPKKIAEFKEKYDIPFVMKIDFEKGRAKKMEAKVTPTVAVWNKTQDEILYRGRIDNSYYQIGKRRTITTTSELADALKAIVNGEEIEVKETKAIGCFINYKEKE